MFPPNQSKRQQIVLLETVPGGGVMGRVRGATSGSICEAYAIDYPAAVMRELGGSGVGKKMGTNKCLVKQLLCLYVFPHLSQ